MTKKITLLFSIVFSLSFVSKAQINLQNGLIAYYTFDFTLLDSTTNHFDLVSGGNPGATVDRHGVANNAYHLTGTNPDFFTGSNSATMSPAELTLSAWINLSDPFNDQKIAGKTSVGPGYLMGVDSNKIDVEIWDASNFHMRLKRGNIAANTWTHVAISYKASGYLKIYINGLPVDSLAASSNGVGTNLINDFCIGGAPWDNFALNLDGSVDDVCLYGRQLSDAEMAALFALLPTNLNPVLNLNSAVSIFPNPVSNGILNLQFNKQQQGYDQIIITDYLGKVVYEDQKNIIGNRILEVGNLSNGIYHLQLKQQDGVIFTEKLVLNRN
jgi:hypothetical protein